MTDTTPLDTAHDAMAASETDDHLRLTFYHRLVETELYLLLEDEAAAETVTPRIFATDEGRFVLAFDREHRLTDFTGGSAPYAALSGRALIATLAPEELGIGLNLGVAPSSILVPADAVRWLAATVSEKPEEIEASLAELLPPGGLPETLISTLDSKLATAQGLADMAYLVRTRSKTGTLGHLLAFIDAVPGAEPALSHAASEALIFSGIEAGQMDVAFFRSTDGMAAHLARVGLRFDIPPAPAPEAPSAPGMDPNSPPRLR